MEVQQVGFDCKGIGAEGWAIADVRDGVEGFAGSACADGQGCDVDAVCGKQFSVGGEIDRWHCVARTVAATGGGRAQNAEASAQQSAHVADVALRDQLPYGARRDGFASNGLRRIDADAEAELAAQHLEAVDACFGLIAEVKVFAFVQFGYMQSPLEHVCGEAAGRHSRELLGKGQDENRVDAG